MPREQVGQVRCRECGRIPQWLAFMRGWGCPIHYKNYKVISALEVKDWPNLYASIGIE